MKKKLVVLLAAVMMFAFSASAYAANFSDISEQPVNVQDSIAKTVALGIINGYDDGTFGPEQNITRAEFAKIAVTASGAKETATMLENNKSSFKDVKSAQWYTGWINASESLGIFQGDGNGNFRPNDTITNQEVITVLMRMLGYNDNLTGTWPVNYVTQANKDGILDNVTINAAAAAKRADVVVMLDDTLDTDIVTYDKDTNEFVKKQTTKSGSSWITLMEDSFKGNYYEVKGNNKFDAIDQVRDAAKKQLNWDVVYTYTDSNNHEATGSATLIIDSETRVSANGGTLFDLEDHQGKVYFIKDNDKLYARFIEVGSYTKTVAGKPTYTEGNDKKVTVDKDSYNPAKTLNTITLGKKNSNYVMYFNDDDQVYAVKSDKDYDEKAYYVKAINNTTMRLVGDKKPSTTVSLNKDMLIYDEDKFVVASELKVGDAIVKITDDLYVKVADATGSLSTSTKDNDGVVKVKIENKNYVLDGQVIVDKDFEISDAAMEDLYGNNVRFLLNKDNSVAAIIADETSTGANIYGIVVGGKGAAAGDWGNGARPNALTIFTSEGKTVTYDLKSEVRSQATEALLGQLVEYKLNKDGEIKSINKNAKDLLGSEDEIKIKNNAYLVGAQTVTLASNVIIFEVGIETDGDLDPSIVTRSSLLSGGDFTPEELNKNGVEVAPYAKYFENTNGAAKVLAYTDANTSNYRYGVVDGDPFNDADHSSYDAIKLKGDDTVYDLVRNGNTVTNKDLIVYTMSGDELTIKKVYKEKADFKTEGPVRVEGYSSGLITFARSIDVYDWSKGSDPMTGAGKTSKVGEIMTDDSTVIYVLNSKSGEFEVGTKDSIGKGLYALAPLMDKDGYADLVIVDEYNYDKNLPVEATISRNSIDGVKIEKTADKLFKVMIPVAAFSDQVKISVNGAAAVDVVSGYDGWTNEDTYVVKTFTITDETTYTVTAVPYTMTVTAPSGLQVWIAKGENEDCLDSAQKLTTLEGLKKGDKVWLGITKLDVGDNVYRLNNTTDITNNISGSSGVYKHATAFTVGTDSKLITISMVAKQTVTLVNNTGFPITTPTVETATATTPSTTIKALPGETIILKLGTATLGGKEVSVSVNGGQKVELTSYDGSSYDSSTADEKDALEEILKVQNSATTITLTAE